MSVATIDALSDTLVRDMTWRLREISDLKHAIRTIPEALRESALRAAVPIFYAHWEGHIRVCAAGYVRHISSRRLEYQQLKRGFMLAALRSDFDRLAARSPSRPEQIQLVENVFAAQTKRFVSDKGHLVDTRSNLSFEVLCEILEVVGIPAELFASEESFIDKVLLHKRNNIAHGQNIVLTSDEIDEMSEKIIGLMRTFRNLVENAALAGDYRA